MLCSECAHYIAQPVRQRAKQGRRSGNTLVQTALVLPVLLSLVFGVVEFGQFLYIRHSFQAAAREVARAACLTYAQQADPATRATAMLAQANVTFNPAWLTMVDLTNSNATISNCSTIPIGDRVMVTVQCPYNQIPNTFRPLYAMTGVGVGSGKICLGQSVGIKE